MAGTPPLVFEVRGRIREDLCQFPKWKDGYGNYSLVYTPSEETRALLVTEEDIFRSTGHSAPQAFAFDHPDTMFLISTEPLCFQGAGRNFHCQAVTDVRPFLDEYVCQFVRPVGDIFLEEE